MTIREQIRIAAAQELLTVKQLALLCQLHEQTIWLWAKQGKIPGMFRFGRNGIRFSRAAALAWGRDCAVRMSANDIDAGE